MSSRIFNFSAGPAIMPPPVLEQAQRELVSLPGVGMSVMEISHRSKTFEDLLNGAIADIRELAGIPASYRLLMLQGGASLQFSMVPMNLLTAGATADYVDTGTWADKAIKEAKRVGRVNVTGSTKADQLHRIPRASELSLTPERRLRAHHVEQHHRRHRVAHAAGHWPRAPGRGCIV
jgi:phosphoserine aminotransferase